MDAPYHEVRDPTLSDAARPPQTGGVYEAATPASFPDITR